MGRQTAHTTAGSDSFGSLFGSAWRCLCSCAVSCPPTNLQNSMWIPTSEFLDKLNEPGDEEAAEQAMKRRRSRRQQQQQQQHYSFLHSLPSLLQLLCCVRIFRSVFRCSMCRGAHRSSIPIAHRRLFRFDRRLSRHSFRFIFVAVAVAVGESLGRSTPICCLLPVACCWLLV